MKLGLAEWAVILSTGCSLISAGVAVFVGITLRRFKKERAFDRQLDWYEKTAEALFRFLDLNRKFAFALQDENFELVGEVAAEFSPTVNEFQILINKSLLYADRDLYLRLKALARQLYDLSERITETIKTGSRLPTTEFDASVVLLERAFFELSQPIRKMVGRDKLSLSDFER